MARILKPWFRSRHHRKTPNWNLGKPPKGAGKPKPTEPDVKPVWNLGDPPRAEPDVKPASNLGDPPCSWWKRIDWLLIAVVAVAFVAGFVWLFPG